MRNKSFLESVAFGSVAAVVSSPVTCVNAFGLSYTATFSAGVTGTLELQVSNDDGPRTGADSFNPSSVPNVTDWVTLGASVAVNSSSVATVTFHQPNFYFRWARLRYTPATGTGTMSVRSNTKGTNA